MSSEASITRYIAAKHTLRGTTPLRKLLWLPHETRGLSCGHDDVKAPSQRCETNLDVVVDLLDGLGLFDLAPGHPRVFSQLAKILERET